MSKLTLAIKTLAGAVVFVIAACVVGASLDSKDLYDIPVISYSDTNSVTPVQYTAMQDAKGE